MHFDEDTDTRMQRLLQFLGEMAVNGNTSLNPNVKCIEYAGGVKPQTPVPPPVDISTPPPNGWR